MDRMQPYFRLNKKKKELEVWNTKRTFNHPKAATYRSTTIYRIEDDEVDVVDKLIDRDFMTALLYRRSDNEGIRIICNDILEQKG